MAHETLIGRVRELCLADERLDAALMYGSFAAGEADEHSDVEFWLFFEPALRGAVDPRAWCAQIALPLMHVHNEFGADAVRRDRLGHVISRAARPLNQRTPAGSGRACGSTGTGRFSIQVRLQQARVTHGVPHVTVRSDRTRTSRYGGLALVGLAELLVVANLIHAFMQSDGLELQRVIVASGVGVPFLVHEQLRQLLGLGFADLLRHLVIRYRCGVRWACRLTAAEQAHDEEAEDAVHDLVSVQAWA